MNHRDADTQREKPILFSGPMVRAILEGWKSQTRRVVKPCGSRITNDIHAPNSRPRDFEAIKKFCPWGAPGDRLWVKETWGTPPQLDVLKPTSLANGAPIEYRAGGTNIKHIAHVLDPVKRWRSSLFMCRWMSRLTLEIVAVRVERLQDISEYDCAAEGCCDRTPLQDNEPAGKFIGSRHHWSAVRLRYEALWESINGPGSWAANPWVWVIEFKKL